jgi:phosphopantothenoylcysteine decarboxylase / phosphopantothenate---cysteine ligase
MNRLQGKKMVLGVSGGIAAYKAAELVRLLGAQGVRVHVAMTEAATRFITPLTFQALSGNPVWTSLWDERGARSMAHIELSRQVDALLVAPATADFLARTAQGMADDLLSTLCLARDVPLFVAPAMNRQMWQNPATQRNIARLQEDGVHVIGPEAGEQACGEVGLGRMSEPQTVIEVLDDFFSPQLLSGQNILLTAGPTFEALDPVRGITNPSSGKMGYALARACMKAGGRVVLVSGPVSLPPPNGVLVIPVKSALQMREAVMDHVEWARIFISVAAVADYRPENPQTAKIKKSADTLSIPLIRNPDILSEVANLPERPDVCVGFAAESHDLAVYANEKRLRKNLDLVVGNRIADALGQDDNEITLFDADGQHPLPRAPKTVLAWKIVEHIAFLMARRRFARGAT